MVKINFYHYDFQQYSASFLFMEHRDHTSNCTCPSLPLLLPYTSFLLISNQPVDLHSKDSSCLSTALGSQVGSLCIVVPRSNWWGHTQCAFMLDKVFSHGEGKAEAVAGVPPDILCMLKAIQLF